MLAEHNITLFLTKLVLSASGSHFASFLDHRWLLDSKDLTWDIKSILKKDKVFHLMMNLCSFLDRCLNSEKFFDSDVKLNARITAESCMRLSMSL